MGTGGTVPHLDHYAAAKSSESAEPVATSPSLGLVFVFLYAVACNSLGLVGTKRFAARYACRHSAATLYCDWSCGNCADVSYGRNIDTRLDAALRIKMAVIASPYLPYSALVGGAFLVDTRGQE